MAKMTHSVLGASSSDRWISCPGSVRMSKGIPRTTSAYAAEGTSAHELGEMCLRSGKDAKDYLGTKITAGGEQYEVTEEMAEAVQVYIDTIRDEYVAAGVGATLVIEKKFKLDWLYPGLWGTNDAMIGEAFGTLKIYDYKHGAGVAVEVGDNPQMMYYALGAAHGDAYEDVELVIVQPRAMHRDGPVRRCKMTTAELMNWAEEVLLPGVKATEDPNAPLNVGDHCRFCPALAVCPKHKEKAYEVAKTVFAEVPTTPVPPEAMTYEEMKKILDVSSMIEAWLKSVREHVRNLLDTGAATSAEVGYKIVEGRASRAWSDEKEAEEWLVAMLEDEAFIPKKLVSPAQAEKVLKGKEAKAALKAMITESRGKQMVPLSDKREELSAPAMLLEAVEVD